MLQPASLHTRSTIHVVYQNERARRYSKSGKALSDGIRRRLFTSTSEHPSLSLFHHIRPSDSSAP